MKIKSLLLAAAVALAVPALPVTFTTSGALHFERGLSNKSLWTAESGIDARATVQSLFPKPTVYSAIEVHNANNDLHIS